MHKANLLYKLSYYTIFGLPDDDTLKKSKHVEAYYCVIR